MKPLRDFLLHLRLNYNFFILSGPYFLGAVFANNINNQILFWLAFLLIFVLLFGGANAYNSFFDKDEGPIGGLEHPPQMQSWMLVVSWLLQIIGLVLAFFITTWFGWLYLASIVALWMYSNPKIRFKGKPLLSFLAIAIGTIFNIVLMGYFAAGGQEITVQLIAGAIGACFLILSMYPFSQSYQIEEDQLRGDTTFAVRYGLLGIKVNYLLLFLFGLLMLVYSFLADKRLALTILTVGFLAYLYIWFRLKNILDGQKNYKQIMRLKYAGGILFTSAMLFLLYIYQLF